MSAEEQERLARLEARANGHDAYMGDLHEKIDKVLEFQTRQRGFIAGIVFTVGVLATGVTWLLGGKFHFGG